MKPKPSRSPDASGDLTDEVFGLKIDPLGRQPRPNLNPEALVRWLCEGASVSDKLQVRHIVERADFEALLNVVELAWSRKVVAARMREWQLQKQALVAALRKLERQASEYGASAALRDVVALVEASSPLVGAPVFDPSPVEMDVMLDPDTGRQRNGRPGEERNEIDVLLREVAGITAKDDRRLLLTLLGNK